MNPILALFWKEGREAGYKVVACAGLAMIAGVAHMHLEIPIDGVCHLVGFLGAVLMGMDLIARERNQMTLSSLFCLPFAPSRILVVKFTVGAAGLLAVLAAYWGGVFIGMHDVGNLAAQLGIYRSQPLIMWPSLQSGDILDDVGYVRVVLLWFFVFVIPYSATVLASTLTDHPLKAAMTSLMAAWVVIFLIGITWIVVPKICTFYFNLVFFLRIDAHGEILRHAYDISILLTRFTAAILLAGGVLLCACRLFRCTCEQRIPWVVGALALTCGVFVVGQDVARSRPGHTSAAPVPPVGSLAYNMNATDLALMEGMAVVLHDPAVSVVDVSDPLAPAEIGRVNMEGWRFERLALSGSRVYAWGEVRDSVGVAVFDLSRPDRPLMQAVTLLYPVEKGPTPWLRRIPRLVGWAVWEGHLYAGLLRNRLLELYSFDVREKGSPQLVHVLPIEETRRHLWNKEWEMHIAGPHAFLTLGHELVVLNLTDLGQPKVMSRTPLRRFGRSARYEKSVQEVYEGLTSGAYKKRLAKKFENAMGGSAQMFLRALESRGLQSYMIDAPPALGPLTVGNEYAYIERHLPREIAVVDISDPWKPVEVDYIPRTYLPRRLTIEGKFAYALRRSAIQKYVWTSYGTLAPREKLGIGDPEEYLRNTDTVYHDIGISYLARDMFILKGDHIYALLDNHLAIFENPRKTE